MCGEFGPVRLLQGPCACCNGCERNASFRLVPLTLGFVGLTLAAMLLVATGGPALAASPSGSPEPIYLLGIPVDFILFALTLLGVALFHHYTLQVALTGLAAIVVYKLGFTGFKFGQGFAGLALHMQHEWVILANLFLLLMGFALLSRHFEESKLPDVMPAFLPDDWKGAFALLVIVAVMSSFLDNIAAALIGGVMAREVFRGKVHIGYLAAIVAAANAGGAGSVVGDTTTTMMWIAGVSPLVVIEAYAAVAVAIFIFGIPAAMQQHRYSPIMKDTPPGIRVEWPRVVIVFAILVVAILSNVTANIRFPAALDQLPVIGLAVWVVILVTTPWRTPDWKVMPETFKGTIFLLALVTSASLMPVETLPAASWQTALGLGYVSAVFDNIPLTALALKQGGYDWGFLAYAVGFGGSMIWFGSSAGVALSNMYPEATVGRPVAQARLAHRRSLYHRLLLHAGDDRLASRRAALSGSLGRLGSASSLHREAVSTPRSRRGLPISSCGALPRRAICRRIACASSSASMSRAAPSAPRRAARERAGPRHGAGSCAALRAAGPSPVDRWQSSAATLSNGRRRTPCLPRPGARAGVGRAASRSSSAPPPAWARPTRCCRRRTPS